MILHQVRRALRARLLIVRQYWQKAHMENLGRSVVGGLGGNMRFTPEGRFSLEMDEHIRHIRSSSYVVYDAISCTQW